MHRHELPVPTTAHGAVWVFVVALGVLLSPSTSRADVVGPPPDDCPAGTEARSSHCGSYCVPRLCAGDGDCDDGQTCQPRQLCRDSIECQGGWDPDAAPTIIETANQSCAAGDCPAGTCESTDVCAEPPQAFEVDQGCGCRYPSRDGREADPLKVIALLALTLAALGRRRAVR